MSAERWTGKMLTPQEAADISGIDAHDVNLGQAVLEPGWIISDEPGLYIDEEEIGIRIEDDLLITEDGCEVLSADILRDPDEIEAFMKKYR